MKARTDSRFAKLTVLAVILALLPLLSGCSMSGVTEKIFGKAKPMSNLQANALYFDNSALTGPATQMINAAQNTIYVEQYAIDRQDLMNLLCAKAKQGLQVKVLLDQSAPSAKSSYKYLRAHNVDVHYYPTELGQYAEAKLLVVDDTTALLGGNPWTNTGRINHDVAVALPGKAALTAAQVFARDWKFATTIVLKVPTNNLPTDNIILAANPNIQTIITSLVQQATTSIQIEVGQLTYPSETITALADMAATGKQVQIILDAALAPSESQTIAQLKASGVEIRFYPATSKSKLSAHFAVFDHSTALLGSANWTHSSFVQNHELDVQIPSLAVSERLIQQFNQDWAKSLTSLPPK
ncbi:MAG: phosphatidylserine/phosphatidylglycerophosphate/cardiolipin synthase family protein [Peptococcaceae bacterium]|nr:phosphatidylserine/phosphatidylglycerophosphate/cardiolipin synthase family protein [Peptococcaceae bacterium]